MGISDVALDHLYDGVACRLAAQDYGGALALLDTFPTEARAEYAFWYLQGEVLANQGQYDQALDSLDRALALHGNMADIWVAKAVCLLHLSQPQSALRCCEHALKLQPHHAQAWLFHGVASHRLGHYHQAYTSYRHALRGQSPRPQHHPKWLVYLQQWGILSKGSSLPDVDHF
ncbi:hypothetical protein XM38_030440 [Halomicronema hongdechloris C2206]|uniref:Uncharacterized protein n=1 Tax=Halomicronema hongdechloris C2206 TaxID=1641165 RepID=A0A1Z3HP77_9CYAN|nr:tetratricopeptide repeat protein [Halomicronema hongdechloris]ASC72090.1 hypothetical protein XM38_030440 [Halomicronema hongdechloris C2206]